MQILKWALITLLHPLWTFFNDSSERCPCLFFGAVPPSEFLHHIKIILEHCLKIKTITYYISTRVTWQWGGGNRWVLPRFWSHANSLNYHHGWLSFFQHRDFLLVTECRLHKSRHRECLNASSGMRVSLGDQHSYFVERLSMQIIFICWQSAIPWLVLQLCSMCHKEK